MTKFPRLPGRSPKSSQSPLKKTKRTQTEVSEESSSPPSSSPSSSTPSPPPNQPRASLNSECPSSLLPRYLTTMVQHSHEDFFISLCFDPRLLVQLMCEGFLPIATSRYLIPKLHSERCVIHPLSSESSSCLVHTSKSTRKKSKRFFLTFDQNFDGVVRGCHEQHGEGWLYPSIVASFKNVHERSKNGGGGIDAMLIEEETAGSGMRHVGSCPVRFYSVEIWNAEGALVAGELGYAVGTIYTSLTGFSREDSSGSVQLAVLGAVLADCGFEMWDLGMDLEYKGRLGARNMKRIDFLRFVKEKRKNKGNVLSWKDKGCDEKVNCKDILTKGDSGSS